MSDTRYEWRVLYDLTGRGVVQGGLSNAGASSEKEARRLADVIVREFGCRVEIQRREVGDWETLEYNHD